LTTLYSLPDTYTIVKEKFTFIIGKKLDIISLICISDSPGLECYQSGTFHPPKCHNIVRLALFRIYQHAISNVIRHAEAHNVMISLSINAENVILEIKDDGKGFELPARWIELAREDHLSLVGTAERAQAINARLTIETAPGANQAWLPSPFRFAQDSSSSKVTTRKPSA
jgi:signal transduction histidine kinase